MSRTTKTVEIFSEFVIVQRDKSMKVLQSIFHCKINRQFHPDVECLQNLYFICFQAINNDY